jgi:hypothetical protein
MQAESEGPSQAMGGKPAVERLPIAVCRAYFEPGAIAKYRHVGSLHGKDHLAAVKQVGTGVIVDERFGPVAGNPVIAKTGAVAPRECAMRKKSKPAFFAASSISRMWVTESGETVDAEASRGLW